MSDFIYFEQPLNERVRTLLRLEHLFNAIQQHAARDSEWDSRCCCTAMMEAVAVLSRGDLKSELMKELERFSNLLQQMRSAEGVDDSALNSYIERIDVILIRLRKHRGQLGQELRNSEFLGSMVQRLTIPGGSCQFDLPNFHFWLKKPLEDKLDQFEHWLQDLALPLEATNLMLSILRGSSHQQEAIADKGTYTKSLEGKPTAQLIRVAIDNSSNYYPEISGNKHRFTIRFFSQKKPTMVSETTDIPVKFQLSICRL